MEKEKGRGLGQFGISEAGDSGSLGTRNLSAVGNSCLKEKIQFRSPEEESEVEAKNL